jgi:hypothetical protein
MKFSDIVQENDYFSMQYSPVVDPDGDLFALRPKIKLFPWINSLFPYGEHVSNLDDFFLKCRDNDFINIHFRNELFRVIRDISNFKGIASLRWITLDYHHDFNIREAMAYFQVLSEEFDDFGTTMSLLVKGDIDVKYYYDISRDFPRNLSYSYSIDNQNIANFHDIISLLTMNNVKGPLYIHHEMFKDESIAELIDYSNKIDLDIIAYGINTSPDFFLLKSNEVKFFEGEYILPISNGDAIKRKFYKVPNAQTGSEFSDQFMFGFY